MLDTVHLGLRYAVAAALPLCLCACSGFLLAERDHHRLHTSLPAPTAAWSVAALCRSVFAGADPSPRHAGAPVEHDGSDFVVRYVRGTRGSYRVALNARLLPPNRPRGGGEIELGPIVPVCEPRTGIPSSAAAGVTVVIEAAPRGAVVNIDVLGEVCQLQLGARLERVLALAEAVDACAALMRAGRCSAAAVHATRTLQLHRTPADGPEGRLRALLRLCCATDAERRGDLLLARQHVVAALQSDGQLHAAHSWQRSLDHRLARSVSGKASVPALLRQARLLSSRGDSHAAENWVRRALEAAPDCRSGLVALAEVYRQRGDHRRAYETTLRDLQVHGVRADLLHALQEDALRRGAPRSALRWSLRGREAPAEAVAGAGAGLDPELARRIAHTEQLLRGAAERPAAPPR